MSAQPADAQLLDLLGAVHSRPITVRIDRAHERRLRANLARYDEGLIGESEDQALEIALLATSDRGLHEGESDAGVWTDVAGRECPLPRRVRSPWRSRLRFAWRAARTSWRAT